jgi:hypothetical protein
MVRFVSNGSGCNLPLIKVHCMARACCVTRTPHKHARRIPSLVPPSSAVPTAAEKQ